MFKKLSTLFIALIIAFRDVTAKFYWMGLIKNLSFHLFFDIMNFSFDFRSSRSKGLIAPFMVMDKKALKRDSSLEGPENFQGENGGGGFNPPGGSY